MSESESDNNKKTIIETEVEDSEVGEKTQEQADTLPEPVKKGSFFNFLAFVMSLVAIGLSAYIYYLQVYKQPINDDKEITSSILLLEKHSNKQFKTLNQSIEQLQINNQQLKSQIVKIQEETQQANSSVLSNDSKPLPNYDDSSLVQQINLLQNKLTHQDELIEDLQNNINSSNTKNSQSLQLLSDDLRTIAEKQPSETSIIVKDAHVKSMAGFLLQEAYVQLNIKGNIVKSQNLISKTNTQLSKLTGMRYGYLATDLEKFSDHLNSLEPADVEALKEQIDQLSESTKQLSFVNSEPVEASQEDSSWYDNLISVKKIDNTKQLKLSKNDQTTINNVISNHYQMLKIALMSKNQSLWQSEIVQVQNLLHTYYEQSADEINTKLSELSSINIDLKLPDLETYLQQFNGINLANENE